MGDTITSFMFKRIQVASALNAGKCGGLIKDAILILSSALSAVASEIWPGEGFDRKRITEVLAKYSTFTPAPTTISIPMLYQALDPNSEYKPILRSHFLPQNQGRLLIDVDVDKQESEILKVVAGIPSKTLRQHSYANLFYTELRSGLVHEYQTTQDAHLMPDTTRTAAISYANAFSARHIVFHFDWLIETLRSVANNVEPLFESLPLSPPTTWWIEGQ